MTILLADDNPGNREVARLALEAVGYEIIDSGGWRGGRGTSPKCIAKSIDPGYSDAGLGRLRRHR